MKCRVKALALSSFSFSIGAATAALVLCGVGCGIQRPTAVDEYACGSGGACESDPLGYPGARALPSTSCASARRLPDNGEAAGGYEGQTDDFAASCLMAEHIGGRDVAYWFDVPGQLSTLTVEGRANYIFVYREQCTAVGELSCEAEIGNFHQSLTNVLAGAYYVVVDVPPDIGSPAGGLGGSTEPTYSVKLRGRIKVGEPCDPQLEFLVCEEGSYCLPEETGGRRSCQPPADCRDSIDNDLDGAVDEDAASPTRCGSPPEVSCTARGNVGQSQPFVLVGESSDETVIVEHRWSIARTPSRDFLLLEPPFGSNATFRPLLGGTHTAIFTAVDNEGSATACLTSITTIPNGSPQIELYYESFGPIFGRSANVDLHVLHPTADRWFQEGLDFSAAASFAALGQPTDWGDPGPAHNPSLTIYGDLASQGRIVEVTSLAGAEPGVYTLGAHLQHAGDRSVTARTYVRILCSNQDVTVGPVELQGEPSDGNGTNPLWKVAEMEVGALNACTVRPIQGQGDSWVIVPSAEARAQR